MTKSERQGTSRSKHILIVASSILIVAVYFVGLGSLPLVGPDEPRYAQVAREMFERNDWVTTTLGGFNWFEKPALAYWLMIIGYKLFGVNEFAARIGSALFGLLTIFTLFLLANFVSKEQDERNQASRVAENVNLNFAFWTLLIAASSIGLLIFSHAATFDIILTFPVTAALACFFAFDKTNLESRIANHKFLVGFYFFTGLALLAKGLVGAVLPFSVIFWYFVAIRRLPSKTFLLSLIWGATLTLAVSFAWYLPVCLRHGSEFINEFFVQQHFARYTSNKYQHPEPFWFFWAVLPGLTLPWLPFLLIAIWKMIFRKSTQKARDENFKKDAFQDLRIFATVWMIVPTVFFTFSGSKLPGYVLPALPGALILISEQVYRYARNNKRRQVFLVSVTAAILIAVPFSLLTVADKFAASETVKNLMLAADSQHFEVETVVNLHDISHSLEFYAANRLVRDDQGRQIKFEGVGEISEFMRRTNQQIVLVLVPLRYEHQLYETSLISARRIGYNQGFALVAATKK